jgi:hypothetical protein
VAGTTQHATFFCHEWLHVSGPREIGRLAGGVTDGAYCKSAFGGRDAGFDRAMIHRDRVVRAQRGRVLADHEREFQPLAGFRQNRHAQLAAAMRDHEIHELGRDAFGSANEIALVLAVFCVDDDDRAAVANGVHCLFDGGKVAGHESAGARASGSNRPSSYARTERKSMIDVL